MTFDPTVPLVQAYRRMGTQEAWFPILGVGGYLVAIGAIISINFALGVLLIILAPFVLTLALIVSMRMFIANRTESEVTPLERPLIRPVMNSAVGLILFLFLVFFGSAFFFVPGAFVAGSLGFFLVFVAVQNDNFVIATVKSWRLAKPHLLRLTIMMLVLLFVWYFLFWLSLFLSDNPFSTLIIGGFGWIYFVAVIAEAYGELMDENQSDMEDEEE